VHVPRPPPPPAARCACVLNMRAQGKLDALPMSEAIEVLQAAWAIAYKEIGKEGEEKVPTIDMITGADTARCCRACACCCALGACCRTACAGAACCAAALGARSCHAATLPHLRATRTRPCARCLLCVL
jgi:hypothetical protein